MSDRDKLLTSQFFTEVGDLLGVDQRMSTAPTDRQTDRLSVLTELWRVYCGISPILLRMTGIGSCLVVSLRCEQYLEQGYWKYTLLLNCGDHPRTTVNVDAVTTLPAAISFVGRVNATVTRARDSLLHAQQRMSEDADQARRDEQLSVGDWVLLSTKFSAFVSCGQQNAVSKYLGPFEILARKGTVAYELRLPASTSRMFSVFHVSMLKRYKDGCRGSAPPPAVLDNGEVEYETEKVLVHHESKTGRRSYCV